MDELHQYLRDRLYVEKKYVPTKILDIGAHKGTWTRMCQKFWPTSHYTCIEAGESSRKHLEAVANDCYVAVLGDTHKKIQMHLIETRPGKIKYTKGASMFSWHDQEHKQERDMVTLSSLVGDDAQYNFIKQDVQGAELLIMQGATDIFKRADYICNEVNKNKNGNMPSLDEMNQYMVSIGFNNKEIIADHGKMDQVDVLYWKS